MPYYGIFWVEYCFPKNLHLKNILSQVKSAHTIYSSFNMHFNIILWHPRPRCSLQALWPFEFIAICAMSPPIMGETNAIINTRVLCHTARFETTWWHVIKHFYVTYVQFQVIRMFDRKRTNVTNASTQRTKLPTAVTCTRIPQIIKYVYHTYNPCVYLSFSLVHSSSSSMVGCHFSHRGHHDHGSADAQHRYWTRMMSVDYDLLM
jgi:hypothetical protein